MTDKTASGPITLPDDNRQALRRVVRACRKASLATLLAGDGTPYASLVTVAVDYDLAPILLLSGLSDHTRNLNADPRVSLLFDGTDGHPNPQTGPRVTLTGIASPTTDERLGRRFLTLHPEAALYAGFGDFGFWRIAPQRVHFVGGFGRAVWFNAPFGLAPAAIAEAAPALITRMNAEHGPVLDRLAGLDGTGWRMVGLDSDGCDLALAGRFVRLAFERPVDGPEAAEAALAERVAHLLP